ncbi:MAG: baseplate assembly protein [Aeromonas popoffii]|uniref:baseplate assembly protein n=1 Tax=Aeromonas popoffii TaxID=70856 RepID=UPI003F33430F
MAGIDLGLLPELSAVKQITHEDIQKEMTKVGKLDELTPSDPAFRVILSGSYRESLLRQEADEQVRSVVLATAHGSDLDNIGVTYYRHVDGTPVTRLEGESDEDYRLRLHDSPGGLSTAGPVDAYEFHSRSAHPNIKQALCTSPRPVEIVMYLLGRDGNGVVSDAQCRLVESYLWNRRPVTDKVTAISAVITNYTVTATIMQVKNPDPDSIMERARVSLNSYLSLQHRLKGKITLSSLHAVMMVAGVDEVQLTGWKDVVCAQHQAPYCTKVTLTFGGWAGNDD